MKTTSFFVKPAAPSASSTHSSIGRPITGTMVFGTSSVRCSSRLPRPAPMITGRMFYADTTHRAVVAGWAMSSRHGPPARPEASTLELVSSDEVVARLSADVPFGAVLAFDADGTLWSGDIGIDTFTAL